MAESTARPRVVMLIPAARQSEVLTPAAMARLRVGAEVVGGDLDASGIAASLPALLADADACLTGWGTPPLNESALAGASHLRLIAHAAGSVKRLIPPSVFERGVVVSHVSSVMADAVAEYTILAILLGLRRVHEMDRSMKAGVLWHDPAIAPQWQLAVRAVGLVGMGYVGRRVVRLLNAFGPRLQVYDPYLSAEGAAALGVESVTVDDVFRHNEIISIHAPITPETHHLVGARQLALLRDGGIFINCARSWVVDPDALLATLQTGRIWAALDVFDREPLSLDSPLRKLPNVLLTPHEAGHTVDTYQRQGDVIVDEIERFFRGDALQHQISPERFALMA